MSHASDAADVMERMRHNGNDVIREMILTRSYGYGLDEYADENG